MLRSSALRRDASAWQRRLSVGLAVLAALLALYHLLGQSLGEFPAGWNLQLREPLDAFKKWMVGSRSVNPLFLYGFDPLSGGVEWVIRQAEAFLLWLPWPTVGGAFFLLGLRVGGVQLGLLAVGCLGFMGGVGLWDASMQTLALMVASVSIALLVGIPLGIWSAHSNRGEAALRPLLDGMQTLPAFVYLIPVVLFFGIGRVPAVIAAVIYAIPPAVRLTSLGLRQVSEEVVEAGRAFGSTPRQLLYKVEIPQALPSILAGVNQTIMMALSIVVIAALVGAGGLGTVVLKSLRQLKVGEALEGGLAIVALAILLDRLTAAVRRSDEAGRGGAGARRGWLLEGGGKRLTFGWWALPSPVRRHGWLWGSLLWVGGGSALCWALGWVDFPKEWNLSLAGPVDAAVRWAQLYLYRIGESGFGTGPVSDFMSLYILAPLRQLFAELLPWPALVLLAAAAGAAAGGGWLALASGSSLLLLGALGMWQGAIDTFTQVVVAVLHVSVIGIPLGIWAARSPWVDRLLRPLLDLLQTIPTFVYLVPVIMLFNLGRVPGVIASVLYALPPLIRLTSLGIRQVDETAVEAATAFGSTPHQLLTKVQLPLALPQILLGINQAIMMVLSMVIVAGMVGAQGLGLEVVDGMQNNRMGQSVEAGLAIVVLAVLLDRLTQALARR